MIRRFFRPLMGTASATVLSLTLTPLAASAQRATAPAAAGTDGMQTVPLTNSAGQVAPTPQGNGDAQSDRPADASPADAAQEVTVTGSRVITNGNDSPSAVTVAPVDQLLAAQPFSVLSGLQSLPAITGGVNGTTGTGATIINLRGIGALRNLVLLDGRRIGPTQNDGSVALDVVPQALLQRIEVVTGGASAVYGSDAVSGVVNFITNRKFNGLQVDLRSGISKYGDAAKKNASIVGGRDLFGGRGHIEASYEYRQNDGVRRADRPYLSQTLSEQGSVPPVNGVYQQAGTAANPYALLRNTRLSTSSFGGLINTGPLAGLNFATNGVLTPFVHGALTGTNGVEVGGDGSYYLNPSLEAAQYTHQEFARFDFDATDSIHFFVQGAASQTHFSQYAQTLLLNQVAIGYNNPYLASVQAQYQPTIAAQLAANPLGSFNLSKMDTQYPQQYVTNQEDYYTIVAGLEGKLGWLNWDASYTRTVSSNKMRNEGGVNTARFLAAVNAVRNPATGQIVCNAALVNPTVYGGCVPLNLFGPTSENQQALNYIRNVFMNEQLYKTDDFQGTLRGAPFSLPAGPVGMAVSGEYRKTSLQVKSNSLPTTAVDCTGIQFGCSARTMPFMGPSSAVVDPVHQSVYEFAYEINVPIFANAVFAKEFNLNGAARYTHYSTSGGVETWKVGADWKITDDIRLRGTRSRDIRAPNLNDLYAAASYGNNQLVDLHTNTSGAVVQAFAGNPNLTPEKADTITAGVVLTPRFIPGFSFSADYYKIKIKDALVGISAGDTATQTACEASNGTSPVCALYVRPLPFSDHTAANFPTLIYIASVNVGLFETHGIDFESDYRTMLFGRRLGLRALVNYQPTLRFNNGPAGIVEIAGAAAGVGGTNATPRWKGVGSINYDLSSAIELHAQERWSGPVKQSGVTSVVFVDGNLPAIFYTDATISYNINKNFQASFNVQNLFDRDPRAFAAPGPNQIGYMGGFVQSDDVEGRYFTVSVRMRL